MSIVSDMHSGPLDGFEDDTEEHDQSEERRDNERSEDDKAADCRERLSHFLPATGLRRFSRLSIWYQSKIFEAIR